MIDTEKYLLMTKLSHNDEVHKNMAFRRKYKTENPNCYLVKDRLTVFEKILRTRNTSEDIEWCVQHGADMYSVNNILLNRKKVLLFCCFSLFLDES